jgi:predicted RNA-binding Zn-ribbon protein involved in translation (DUF1610 family)
MPRHSKLDLHKVRASLTTTCAECGHEIAADELRRVDFDHVRCPQCGKDFVPAQKNR